MNMTDFRRMAAKMEQHMQQLEASGVTEPHQVIDRMMGYTPELHQIWTGTSDRELMALAQDYPGFYRYAVIMETAFEQERQKPSRPYDGLPELSTANKHAMEKILTTAATLERGYLAYQGNPLPVFDESVARLNAALTCWLAELDTASQALISDENITPAQREYVQTALRHIAERLTGLRHRAAPSGT